MFGVAAYAQTTSEFGYQLHPEKLLENTVGTLQIFVMSNEMMLPSSINDLKVISSDNSIIQIIDIQENNNDYTKNVQLKAIKPGIVDIAIAAPGFSSKEITLEVFNNNNYPSKILMKVTPNDFPIDGPRFGYVAVGLATTGGLPTIATEDMTIKIETPNKDVLNLKNSELIIKKGEYFAISEFNVINSGDAIIFANAEDMTKVSQLVHVRKPSEPLEIKLFTFPSEYNSFSGGKGYAIVQLLDSTGFPVKAEEDIIVKLGVDNPNMSVNTSHDFEEIQFNSKEIVIKKGEYSAYTAFTPRPNLGKMTTESEQTLNMYISTNNYLTKDSTITITNDDAGQLEGEGPSVTNVLPFLTTGKKELIAVTYFETDIEVSRKTGTSTLGTSDRELVTVTVPVTAKQDYEINFASSKSNTVSPINPIMKKGENIALVFGNTGTISSADPISFYVTDNRGVKTYTGNPIGPVKDDLVLTVEPLIPQILAEHEFPIIAYLLENEGDDEESTVTTDDEEEENGRIGISFFIEDSVLTLSANNIVDSEHEIIKKNQPYVISNLFAKEVGTAILSFQAGQFEGTMDLISSTTDPAKMHMSFAKNLLTNTESLATIQLLDSVGNPVFAKNDISIKIVSNNESILEMPKTVTIKKGEYFNTIKLESRNEGLIEVALLSEDLPLAKYDIQVVDITPTISLDLVGGMNWNERIEAKLSVAIPEVDVPLHGFNVNWDIDGGEILKIDNMTDIDGIARAQILANDKEVVTISADVSGNGFSSSSVSTLAEILNKPLVTAEPPKQWYEFDESTIMLITIPISVIVALFVLKRIDRLDAITEKFGIGEKFEEIKEKISNLRNR